MQPILVIFAIPAATRQALPDPRPQVKGRFAAPALPHQTSLAAQLIVFQHHIARGDPARLMADFFAGYQFLRDHGDGTGRVGCVGFCYGGGVCNALAVAFPDLAASVPFYGRQPAVADVAQIRAPLMLHYAGLDERINAGWPAYEQALKDGGKDYRAFVYPGVNHGFHNDTTPRYDEAAARLAWDRTLAFFGERLR